MYIATFYTHYGAQVFYNKAQSFDANAKMMPVPRAVSASCGTCVYFNNVEGEDRGENAGQDRSGGRGNSDEKAVTDYFKKTPPEDIEAVYLWDGAKKFDLIADFSEE